MFRVIHSTIQRADIDDERAEEFLDLAEAATAVRETYSLDELRQKTVRIALVPYTDPDGARRFALCDENEADVDWQDTDDVTEALEFYERTVRETAEGCADGQDGEQPVFSHTDVPGIDGCDPDASESGTHRALVTAAQWAQEEWAAAEAAAKAMSLARDIAFARAVDHWGRGAQASLARAAGVSEPTVKYRADQGRGYIRVTLISARAGDQVPGVELGAPDCPDLPYLHGREDVQKFLTENGDGDELIYLVTGQDASIPAGFPALTVRI